jgi:ABC-type multidrug transport system ATPase subunit
VVAAISVQGLSKRFGSSLALDDVSFDVPAGSLSGLLGPNGAGKTTLFSCAAGFLHPTSGTIEVLGTDVRAISRLRGRFSMLPQDAAFQSGIPVIEQLVMFARLNGCGTADARQAAQNALEVVGLGEVGRKAARTLSHGMLKRVALCQAFLGEPEVVFLDEPTSGLDPENARKMRELIRGMRGNRTVVLSSHNLQEVQDLCDHVTILHQGKVLETGSMADLTSSSFLLRIAVLKPLPDAAAEALRALAVVDALELTGPAEFNLRLNLTAPSEKEEATKQILATLARFDVYPRSLFEGASLEARFLEITGGTYDGASSR